MTFTNEGAVGNGVELASAELGSGTYSILESKYYFAFQTPPNGYYKLTWDETFTPDGGGAPTSTPRTFTWDGTTPSGYNVADPTTWPVTPTLEVDPPASNGTITITNLVVACYSLGS
jgi:hypothetical protein